MSYGISFVHDDMVEWKHFPCYWPFVRGIHRSLPEQTVEQTIEIPVISDTIKQIITSLKIDHVIMEGHSAMQWQHHYIHIHNIIIYIYIYMYTRTVFIYVISICRVIISLCVQQCQMPSLWNLLRMIERPQNPFCTFHRIWIYVEPSAWLIGDCRVRTSGLLVKGLCMYSICLCQYQGMQLTREHNLHMNIMSPPIGWNLVISFPPGKNGRHFADGLFKCIFVDGKFRILIQSSVKFVPKGPIDNNPALV